MDKRGIASSDGRTARQMHVVASPELAIETDLTDEEKAIIQEGRKAHEAGEHVSLNLL